ncbi:MAG: zinc metalloprotease [Reichenbachiella sp.]|uniref:zinc metalloprotease n=1 Tax=Reichenbachiella sp. TaxID=2184521 RepID=UPI003266A80E
MGIAQRYYRITYGAKYLALCLFAIWFIPACFLFSHPASGQAEIRKCPVEYSENTEHPTQRLLTSNETIFTIPVVVHVVYQNKTQDLSPSQIQSQIHALNLDFRKKNQNASNTVADFSSLAADIKIEFELAEIDPMGASKDGITRTATEHVAFANNDLHASNTGGADPWDSDQYLNIWVANLTTGIIGYASSPTGDDNFEGIAIHYENFGTEGTAKAPYDLGRTLTHEVGHWLGLQHLWGDGGCSSDDDISDTPNQQQSSSSCSTSKSSCGSLDMVQNFMDFSEDACMTLFTRGQAEAMRTSLTTHRPEIFSEKAILESASSDLKRSEIQCFYSNGILKINLNDMLGEGELSIYDLSGGVRLHQQIKEVKPEMEVVLGNHFRGMHVVRYKTSKGSFFAKFINNG